MQRISSTSAWLVFTDTRYRLGLAALPSFLRWSSDWLTCTALPFALALSLSVSMAGTYPLYPPSHFPSCIDTPLSRPSACLDWLLHSALSLCSVLTTKLRPGALRRASTFPARSRPSLLDPPLWSRRMLAIAVVVCTAVATVLNTEVAPTTGTTACPLRNACHCISCCWSLFPRRPASFLVTALSFQLPLPIASFRSRRLCSCLFILVSCLFPLSLLLLETSPTLHLSITSFSGHLPHPRSPAVPWFNACPPI